MGNIYIAASYWRSIKRNNRTYASIPYEMKEPVLVLAKTDVVNGVISAEDYTGFIGAAYEA
ncbi:hypothetical protein ACS3UN_02215 [Oscillospiraceae bacterium LTW-04]|nr:hypothetical protein RBH76_08245 [Oscillospiraceae bacterium MB24-C1]